MKSNLAPILLVAENARSADNLQDIFRLQGIENPVQVTTTFSQALDLLRGISLTALNPVPILILLDVASPVSGFLGFLEELRQNPALKASSVFVLSSQSAAQDMQESYELNVAGYILKPMGLEALAAVIATLPAF